MPSEVQICNLALTQIGAYSISSLDDKTKEAKACKTFFTDVRDSVLYDHDWGFARKRIGLALLNDSYSGWVYAYQYPTDCIAARKIYDDSGALADSIYDDATGTYMTIGKIEYEIAVNADLTKRVILTNRENAELFYTAKITDTNLFSPLFIKALTLQLAAALCVPVRGKAALKKNFVAEYIATLGQAKAADAREGHKKPDDSISLVEARI